MKYRIINKIGKYIALPIYFSFIFATSNTYGGIIHQHTTEHIVTGGVTYELNRQIRSNGLLNIHVIRINMESPGITVGPAIPTNYGTRHTTSSLLSSNGAVAGINGDFFDMTANPVTPMGQVVQNGNVVSINRGEAGYATFFVNEDNNPFIRYVRPEIIFTNNGHRNIQVESINKFERDFFSALFDRQAITNTEALDERFEDLVKLVIEDDIITHISEPGEIVVVPEEGYIIVLSYRYSMYFTESINVGDSAEVSIEASVDFESLNSAIGGAGKILENGIVSNSGYVVAPNARHPRSAVGVNQDGTEVILVAVDGRGDSVGATHGELANIMLQLGAYNAMHLDGGGSTTMAVQTIDDDHVRVVNTVSDGSQRRVVNALGVYNNAQLGKLTSVTINTYPNNVFYGGSINVYPFGLDGHLSRIDLDMEQANITSDDIYGTWEGNTFRPSRTGEINFTLVYNDLTFTTSVQSFELAQLTPEFTSIDVESGQRIQLNLTGKSTFGHTSTASGMNFEVYPASLGHVENNIFIATSSEPGYIKASIGNISTHIIVNGWGQGIAPVSNEFINPFRQNLLGEPYQGSFDITFVGNIDLHEELRPDEYIEIQNNALLGFRQHSLKGVFAGTSDIEYIPGLNLGRWSRGYRFITFNNVAIVNLDATRGNLTTTAVYNWSFVNESKNSNADHIIIKMNRQPSTLTSVAEREAFRDALEDIASTGKSIFVISTEGIHNTSFIKNGVNYINIGSLFNQYGSVNDDFSVLRFRVTNDNIKFDIQNAF